MLRTERQRARMSKITDDGLTRTHTASSVRQMVKKLGENVSAWNELRLRPSVHHLLVFLLYKIYADPMMGESIGDVMTGAHAAHLQAVAYM